MTNTVDELMRLVYFIAGNYHLAEGAQAPIEREKHDLLYREHVAALRSALEEVVANDRRYRWLRNEANFASRVAPQVCMLDCLTGKADALHADAVDSFIDAAMQQAPEQEG